MAKITKTFTIDADVWKKYDALAKKNGLNKSLSIENFMIESIKRLDNVDYYDNVNITLQEEFDSTIKNKWKKVWSLKDDEIIEHNNGYDHQKLNKGTIIAAVDYDNKIYVLEEYKHIFSTKTK